MKPCNRRILVALSAGAFLLAGSLHAQNFTWIGPDNSSWSNAANWSPAGIPNGTSVDATIPWQASGNVFNGPQLNITVQLHNLTLLNRAVINTPDTPPRSNLTVLGTTSMAVSPDRPGEYGILSDSGGTFTLGNLTNYNAATKTLESGGYGVGAGGVMQWNNADIVTNGAFIFMSGATSRIQRQQDSFNALTNLAVNNGSMQLVNGANFTTSGNFTNNGGIGLGGFDAIPTTFTVTGNLTNYDAATHTLNGGNFVVDGTPATAVFRFSNADIRALANFARVELRGDGHMQDLFGNDALRNLSMLSFGSSVTNTGTLTIKPGGTSGGTLTNDGATHKIAPGAQITIDGNHTIQNFGTLSIGAPSNNSSTAMMVNGQLIVQDGGGLDMGGQPGVNTQYHTELHVMNGIEFRGAYLTGTGTTFADVAAIQGSVFRPGHSPGELSFVGNVTMDVSASVELELGGLTAVSEFDHIAQSGGTMTLAGSLLVSFTNGFETQISNSDTFEVITGATLSGQFNNVTDNGYVATNDGRGTFYVSYDPTTVTLSDFQLPLRITALTRPTSSSLRLHAEGARPNEAHEVYSSPDLSPDSFLPLNQTFSTDLGVVEYTVAMNGPRGFYRISFPF